MNIFIDANIYLGALFDTEPFYSECRQFIEDSSKSVINFVTTPEIVNSVTYRIREKHRWLIRTTRQVYTELRDILPSKEFLTDNLELLGPIFSKEIKFQISLGPHNQWRVQELRKLEENILNFLKKNLKEESGRINLNVFTFYIKRFDEINSAVLLKFKKILENLNVHTIKLVQSEYKDSYKKLGFMYDREDRTFVSKFYHFLQQTPDSSGTIITNDFGHLISFQEKISEYCPAIKIKRPSYFVF